MVVREMIMRRSYLRRQTKPIPKRRAKPRRGPLRAPGYRAWLRTELCVIANNEFHVCWPGQRQCDPAHTENNGMRSKGTDSSCAPLCRLAHQEYDAGRVAFEEKYGIDMKLSAAAHWILFRLERGVS